MVTEVIPAILSALALRETSAPSEGSGELLRRPQQRGCGATNLSNGVSNSANVSDTVSNKSGFGGGSLTPKILAAAIAARFRWLEIRSIDGLGLAGKFCQKCK
jgi:hypothetical protein